MVPLVGQWRQEHNVLVGYQLLDLLLTESITEIYHNGVILGPIGTPPPDPGQLLRTRISQHSHPVLLRRRKNASETNSASHPQNAWRIRLHRVKRAQWLSVKGNCDNVLSAQQPRSKDFSALRNEFVIDQRAPDSASIRTEVRPSLGDLSGEWDSLVDVQALPSPFLKSWWVDNAHSSGLAIVCVFRDEQLVGGAAFETGSWGPRALRVEKVTTVGAGLLAPDHLDLIYRPEDRRLVTAKVLGYLLRPGNRLIQLEGLRADGVLAALFEDATIETFKAPYASLPGDFDEYLGGRPGRVRSTIKRRSKTLATEGAKFRRIPSAEVEDALHSLEELHDERWGEGSGFLDAFDRFSRAIRAGIDVGGVAIHDLRLHSGATIAIEVDFLGPGRVSFYQAGRRTDHEWRGAGSVLRAKIISACIEQGAREYDMLRGDENYKAEWATSHRMISDHRFAVGLRAKALLATKGLKERFG